MDPIDGTFNFVRGGDEWAISIGLYEEGRPSLGVVHAPARHMTLVGGLAHQPLLNGQPVPPLPPFIRDRASVAVGLNPAVAVEARISVLRALMADVGARLRCCNSATISMLEVVRGEADAYLGLGQSAWDVMGALPILERLGAMSTLDWSVIDLRAKLHLSVGKPDLVALTAPLLK